MTSAEQAEYLTCSEDPFYFLDRYAHIYDATARDWVPFRLWPAQVNALDAIHAEQLVVILKARQLGLSWLVLGYALWLMLFCPAATVLLFSKREEESTYLLGDERLRGMYDRLPPWLCVPTVEPDAARTWALANGSVCRAFPSNAGDSYTASFVLVDEADLVPSLDKLLRSVKPTIDGGGKMVLLSRADKTKPESPFKRTYREAKEGKTPWRSVFLPWHVRPGRDAAWYESQRQDILHRTGSLDDLHEQYPATDVEALAPRSLDKRIHPDWLQQCYAPADPAPRRPSPHPQPPPIPGLVLYAHPQFGKVYVIGADPAEGNPTSDESALEVLDAKTGEEVAFLAGRFQPSTFAAHIDAIGRYFNGASVLVERNNHGHAVLLCLGENSKLAKRCGHDGKTGWLSSEKGKALLYSTAADAFREGDTVLHSFGTFNQLASVEGSTLSAPSGEHDDRAVAYALALVAAQQVSKTGGTAAPFAGGTKQQAQRGASNWR